MASKEQTAATLEEITKTLDTLDKTNLDNVILVASVVGGCVHYGLPYPQQAEAWMRSVSVVSLYAAIEFARLDPEAPTRRMEYALAIGALRLYLNHISRR